jgi:hypothetical protein
MPERRTVQFKAPIAGKAQSNRYSQSIRCAHGLGPAHGASLSKAIAKIGNAELAHFNKQMLIHELIRGFLNRNASKTGASGLDYCPGVG